MPKEFPSLYTPECIVHQDRVDKAKPTIPVTVYEDSAGNHALVHGNHRAYKAYLNKTEIPREVIGRLNKDVSQDPYYRPVSQLQVIK
ncbi:MAG: hypothetical protein PHV63_01915 [Candidatus Daviesbacteria bacterium]|nr:hypothetical protein [Candidatus Daviesbacteria bacterium]